MTLWPFNRTISVELSLASFRVLAESLWKALPEVNPGDTVEINDPEGKKLVIKISKPADQQQP